MLYQSSKGAVEIDTMPLSYAKNALNKLTRTEPERAAEIEALDAHVTKLAAAATEEAMNPRAVCACQPVSAAAHCLRYCASGSGTGFTSRSRGRS